MTTLSPMDRLASLASQRTARTDRLYEATQALLSLLEKNVDVGESATVDGWTLARASYKSNVAGGDCWTLSRGEYEDTESCWLEKPVDGAGYQHRDFNCAWRGPSRSQLLAFAARADKFVAAFAAKLESEAAAIESGAAVVAMAVDAARSL